MSDRIQLQRSTGDAFEATRSRTDDSISAGLAELSTEDDGTIWANGTESYSTGAGVVEVTTTKHGKFGPKKVKVLEEEEVELEQDSSAFVLCSFTSSSVDTDSKMNSFLIKSFRVTSSISPKTFTSQFLSSPEMVRASQIAGAHMYIQSMIKLCEHRGKELAITATEYEFQSPGHRVELYDVKCRSRFEDDVIEKICSEWPSFSGMKDTAPVCPLRRGICIGLLDNSHLILAVGNAKFFYGEEEEILVTAKRGGDKSSVLLTEKANGEYTILSSTKTSDNQTWLTMGSKNVRLCLPYNLNDVSLTRKVFDNIVFAFSNNNANKEEGHRYSYLKDMMELWLHGLDGDAGRPFLAELDQGVTLVGEQVGVHAHIFTGYSRPHIRLFGSLPFNGLHCDLASHLPSMKARLFGNGEAHGEGPLSLVRFEEFVVPTKEKELFEGLDKVATGSMDVYGEGVVAYVYDSQGRCLNLYKYKCQEYAFDRRLRTVLSRTASALNKSGMTWLKLKDETSRIESELVKSANSQFKRMNRLRAEQRIKDVPAMIAFLDRHQATLYCADFSENFVDFLKAVEANREAYLHLANRTFLGAVDTLQDTFKAFLETFAAIHVPFKSIQEIARQVVHEYKVHGGFEKFPCLGIASMPGGGKTAVLREVSRILEEEEQIPCKLCDRDAYVIADPAARGDMIHAKWMEDITNTVKHEKKICLVGNTFGGTFADKLEQQSKTKMFLVAFQEVTVVHGRGKLIPAKKESKDGRCDPDDLERCRAAVFSLECLRRLFNRQETYADGSTLSMGLGSKIVLDKFFSAQPEAKMLERRLKSKTAALISVIAQTDFNFKETYRIAEAICKLKQDVAAPVNASESSDTREKEMEEKVHRTSYVKSTLDYVKQSLTVPAVASGVLSRIRFAGLSPENLNAKRLLALADVDLLRTDCHVTISYQPDEKGIKDFIKSFIALESGVEIPLLGRVTVSKMSKKKQHKLQFLALGNVSNPVLAKLMPKAAHVTLGSSNPDHIPHSTSGKVMLELLETKIINDSEPVKERQGPIALKDGFEATIEPIPVNMVFFGYPAFYTISRG